MNRRHDDEAPILITEAAPSFDEEFAARKKRYSLIMAMRIPCLILAGVFGIGFNLPLVAVGFIVLSVPLPWIAVLIANDRMPLKAGKVNKYRKESQKIADTDRRVIEAAEVLEARDTRGPRSSTGTPGAHGATATSPTEADSGPGPDVGTSRTGADHPASAGRAFDSTDRVDDPPKAS